MKKEFLTRLENSAIVYDISVYKVNEHTIIDVTVTDEDCAEWQDILTFIKAHGAKMVNTSYPTEYHCNDIELTVFTQEREEWELECC